MLNIEFKFHMQMFNMQQVWLQKFVFIMFLWHRWKVKSWLAFAKFKSREALEHSTPISLFNWWKDWCLACLGDWVLIYGHKCQCVWFLLYRYCISHPCIVISGFLKFISERFSTKCLKQWFNGTKIIKFKWKFQLCESLGE